MKLEGNPAGIPELGFTHGGRFHADDVFSTALLQLLRPDIRVYRGFEVPKNFSGIVYDIGDGPFDHHARERERRPGGVPYAAFGLLWREYGRFFLPEAQAKSFDDKFIAPLDMDDNNGTGNVVATLIGAFNPSWDSNEDIEDCFTEAALVARKILERRIETFAATARAEKAVKAALATMRDGLVVLPTYMPWKPVLIPTEAEFVLFPSARGGLSLQCVSKDTTGKAGNKVPLPTAWRGKPMDELRRITGVEDVLFCHASGFMATVESEAGARKLAALARQEEARRQQQAAQDRQAAGSAGAAGAPKRPEGGRGPA